VLSKQLNGIVKTVMICFYGSEMYMKSNFCSVARRHVGRDRCSQKQLLLAIQERLSVTASRSVKPNLQDRNLKNWN